mgnify:CR=1 FL=1
MQLESVKTILGDVLSLGPCAQALTRDSALLGSIPELDSMAVVQLLTALEEHYGFTIEDDDISARAVTMAAMPVLKPLHDEAGLTQARGVGDGRRCTGRRHLGRHGCGDGGTADPTVAGERL